MLRACVLNNFPHLRKCVRTLQNDWQDRRPAGRV